MKKQKPKTEESHGHADWLVAVHALLSQQDIEEMISEAHGEIAKAGEK